MQLECMIFPKWHWTKVQFSTSRICLFVFLASYLLLSTHTHTHTHTHTQMSPNMAEPLSQTTSFLPCLPHSQYHVLRRVFLFLLTRMLCILFWQLKVTIWVGVKWRQEDLQPWLIRLVSCNLFHCSFILTLIVLTFPPLYSVNQIWSNCHGSGGRVQSGFLIQFCFCVY
jgi:hypothetical protein